MEPTIFKGDRVIVNQHYYRKHPLKDGDIIAFRHGENILLKRISALPGEVIEGKNGVLFRDGHSLVEAYAVQSKDAPIPEIETFGARVVPQGELFVTGDSRDASLDSRSQEFGRVHTSDVLGKLVYVYMSPHADQIGRSF
jgi:signal peptidase I